MIRTTLIAVALLAAAGCAPQNDGSSNSARATTQAPTVTELAAYAASRHFPTSAPSQADLHVAAIVNRSTGIIKLYNFDAAAIRNIDVWVNQAFVLHVAALAPNASVEIKLADMYNAVGRNLASQNEPIRQVQLVIDGSVHNALGPASE